jgi:hypothetical protein
MSTYEEDLLKWKPVVYIQQIAYVTSQNSNVGNKHIIALTILNNKIIDITYLLAKYTNSKRLKDGSISTCDIETLFENFKGKIGIPDLKMERL